MDKFAFLLHNTDWKLLAKAFDEPLLDFEQEKDPERKRMAERVSRWTDPFKCSSISGIKSRTGKEIEGYFIFSMLVPEQFLHMNEEFLLEHLRKAGDVAKDLGAKILGLGAYTALVGKRGYDLAKIIDTPVTTGAAYTIATTIDALVLAAKYVRLDWRRSNCVIVGATGKIGRVCARIFVESIEAGDICLVARNESRLNALATELESIKNKNCTIKISTDIRKFLKDADVVLFTTNYPGALISVDDIAPGMIICDVSVPKNVPAKVFQQRKDILLLEGGIIKPPGKVDFNFFFGPSQGLAYACIAETMILTLERRFESYSLGSNVSLEKVHEISKLGKKQGFVVDKIRSQYGEIMQKRISETSKAIVAKKKSLEAR